ncbi:Flagellar hook-associated protein 1 [Rickettsiales bacterium Ac37b]|nr:Flagellar hook-associated protein 1 [Rickettsiales bacterium Ac37b]
MSSTLINSSLASIDTAKKSLEVISNNIANVNTKNYSKRSVKQEALIISNNVQGVKISGITRDIDQLLMDSVRDEGSSLASLKTLNQYYEQIQLMVGKPDQENTLTATMNQFFSALSSLTTSPNQTSLHLTVVQQGETFANNLSSLAQNLQELRHTADKEIYNSVNSINNILKELAHCNDALNNLNNIGADNTSILEQRDTLLRNLAEHLDIYTYYNKSGAVAVNAAEGKALLDISSYSLNYSPTIAKEAFINNNIMSPVTITATDSNGNRQKNSEPVILVSSGYGELGGQASTVETSIKSGKIKSLLEMRDTIIPKFLDELDNLAYVFAQEYNKIHNDGSSFKAAKELTGTRPLTLNETHKWDGEVMIGLVNNEGLPLEKADTTPLKPLTLNLSHIRSDTIDGEISSKTIIEEINQYFYHKQINNRLELGNLDDIKMVAYNNLSTTPNGQFTFDFELDNNSQLDSSFKVLAVTVTDPGCAGLTSTLPGYSLINAGDIKRTSHPITVDFAGGAGGPYTINVALEVQDANGNSSVANVSFIIDDTPANPDIENSRYVASNVLSGSAQIIPAGTTQGFAYATLVDSEGNEITDNNMPGFLQIKTLGAGYHLSISELTSQELGIIQGTRTNFASNKGFSGFFELNDFFIRNPEMNKNNNHSAVHNSAINLAIRKDIIKTPDLLSVGRLIPTPARMETQLQGYEKAEATLIFNGNPAINDTITINGQTFTFDTISSNNTIEVGATLADTLNNITQILNAENIYTAGTVNNAVYEQEGNNTLRITFKSAGEIGNSFMISANFATITASLNNETSSNMPIGTLLGGSNINQVVEVIPWTYQLSVSTNQTIAELSELKNNRINFLPAGNLTSTTVNFSTYIENIITVNSSYAAKNTNNLKNEEISYKGYLNKLLSGSGVNLDEQLADTIKQVKVYNASSMMIKLSQELDSYLLNLLR